MKEYTGVYEADNPHRAQIIRSKTDRETAPLDNYHFLEIDVLPSKRVYRLDIHEG